MNFCKKCGSELNFERILDTINPNYKLYCYSCPLCKDDFKLLKRVR